MGRVVAFALMCLALVGGAQAAPAAPDDRLIVPGHRVGRWSLALTLDDLMRTHGYAVRLSVMAGIPPAADAVFDYTTYTWDGVPVAAMVFAGRRQIEYLMIGFLMPSASTYRTDAGIGFLARRARIVGVYGRPTAVNWPHPFENRLIYDHLGIAFSLDMAGRAHTIYVFRRGTADRFWHLL